MTNPSKRVAALQSIVQAFANDNPHANAALLVGAINGARSQDPSGDPMVVALTTLGSIQAEAEILASYVKFATQQGGGYADFSAPSAAPKLDPDERRALNAALRNAGFDGNGRWDSLGKALMALNDVLEPVWFVPGIPADTFRQRPGGSVALPLVDTDSNVEASNSVVAFAYHDHRLEHRAFEVVAYLS